jgi:hypothetical protein
MASIDESLVGILQASSTVTAICGQRIYPLFARQTAVKPLVVYQRISSVREHAQDGPAGLARPRFQFRCVGNSFSQARSLADAVRASLDGYKGTAGGVVIGAITCENEVDLEDVATDSEATAFSVLLDFFVWHGE